MGLQRIKGKAAQPTPPAEPTNDQPPAVPPLEWYPVETLPPVAEYGGPNNDNRDRPLFTIAVLALGWLKAKDGSREPYMINAMYSFIRRRWVFLGRATLEASGYTFDCRYWSYAPTLPQAMIAEIDADNAPAELAEPAPEGPSE